MDFLDPKKERRSRRRLLIGYCLVSLAIGIATLVLLYWAYGYSIDSRGKVTQNGLVFVSSQPNGSAIYLNGQRYKANTNTRVVIPAGTYTLQITQTGYRDWQRQIVVNGGDVQHFDYPFLFPAQLKTSSLADLSADPTIATQSPDKRWLLLGDASTPGAFMEYDLRNPKQPIPTTIKLPDGSFTPGNGPQTWTLVEWASDNRHVLLQHTFTSGQATDHEYILVDRDTPTDSVNLTSALKLAPSDTLNLYNNRVDQFYVYSQDDHTLRRVNVSDGSTVSQLEHVLAFKPYGSDMLLYITDQSPTGKTLNGQVSAVLQDGQQTVTLRSLPAGAPGYDLNLAQYNGDWYVAVAASNDSAAYIYKNPQSEVLTVGQADLAPWRRLPIAGVSFLSFSNNTQFLLAENGQEFVVYDLENVVQYHYRAKEPIDQPQTHAVWMDGDRLLYISGGKLLVFDYDYRNRQVLQPANPAYLPFFSGDYSYVYNLRAGNGSDVKPALLSTPLTTKP